MDLTKHEHLNTYIQEVNCLPNKKKFDDCYTITEALIDNSEEKQMKDDEYNNPIQLFTWPWY